eukprot:gene12851-27091_t
MSYYCNINGLQLIQSKLKFQKTISSLKTNLFGLPLRHNIQKVPSTDSNYANNFIFTNKLNLKKSESIVSSVSNSWKLWGRLFAALSTLLWLTTRKVHALAISTGSDLPQTMTPMQGLAIWGSCFIISAVLHSAESAITKISPFKVQQLAEEEGKTSVFASLSNDITRLLSTILLSTTALSIY